MHRVDGSIIHQATVLETGGTLQTDFAFYGIGLYCFWGGFQATCLALRNANKTKAYQSDQETALENSYRIGYVCLGVGFFFHAGGLKIGNMISIFDEGFMQKSEQYLTIEQIKSDPYNTHLIILHVLPSRAYDWPVFTQLNLPLVKRKGAGEIWLLEGAAVYFVMQFGHLFVSYGLKSP